MRYPLILLSLVAACAGCRDDENGGDGGGGAPAELRANIGLDLAKVAGFVISRSAAPLQGTAFPGSASDGGTTQNVLYAIGKDNSLTVVTVTEVADSGSQSSSQTVEPMALLDTKAYLFISYNNVTYQGQLCRLIAVHKSDGAMYCITDGPSSDTFFGGWAVPYGKNLQSDATGNIVWANFDDLFARYDLSDASHATSTRPLGTQVFGGYHAVNGDGDALITQGNFAGTNPFSRVLLAGGGFQSVSNLRANCITAGPPSDANAFYYDLNVGPTTIDDQWVRLAKSPSGTYTATTLASLGWADCSAGLVRTSNHFFLSGVLETAGGGGTKNESNQIFDIANGTPTTLSVAAFANSRITRIAGYEDALFILGTDTTSSSGIVKYQIATTTFTTLLAPGAYAITTMEVSPGGDLTFYGQRATDGALILGNIPAGATTPTIISTGLPAVTQIQRIN